jgi:sugar lactone lactonase YvrE/truncated hemoglobin YjbI
MTRRSIFEAVGGMPSFEALTQRFYDKVKAEPMLAPVFTSFTTEHVKNVAIWLAEVFGGPPRYSQEHGGHRAVLEKHGGLRLTEAQKDRWIQLMLATAREIFPDDDALQRRFAEYIEWGARIAVAASQPDFKIDHVGPVPVWDWPASKTTEAQPLLTGLAMGESPRWHENRLWFSDWGAQEILAVEPSGISEVALRTPFGLPFCIDWLHDGRLLIVTGREARLVRRERDGSLETHADLSALSDQPWNEIVVDGRENIYVNGGPGVIALITTDGSVRQVANGIAFPNGMAITPDNHTLIIAESHGRKLTAFDIADDGTLSNRRVWADLGTGVPDGICIDAELAVWYADVPNRRCVRVVEGGEVLQTIDVDRGCFACMLGGKDRRTLYVIATEWRGMEKIAEVARARTGQLLTADAPVPGVGWP